MPNITICISHISAVQSYLIFCMYRIQGWGQVQYLYLSTYLSVLEYLVYGNVKVLVLVLDQKVLGTYK